MSEWKKVKLGDVCERVTSGGTPKANITSYYNPPTVPWLKTKEVNYCRITETENYISEEGLANSSAKLIAPNSVIIAMYGQGDTAGRVAINKIPLTTNQACCNLTIDESKADYEFIYYQLCTLYKKMVSLKAGAAQPNLNAQIIKNLEIKLPSLLIQHRIANILSRYDSLIENYQKQIKLLEEAAQRLYKEWFVDLRFPGHENTKIIDGVPEGWELKSVTNNHLFNVAKCPIALFNGNKTYYATADVEGTYFCNSGVKIEYDNKPSRAQIQPSLYSVWFARMSNSFKIVGFVEQNNNRREDSILSSGFAGFESHYERFGFLYCLISSQWFNDQKNRYATGATQVSITNEGLSRIRCILPTTRLAEEFSLVTNKIIEETILYRENCIMLAESRDRLLPKLMSGEIEI